MKDIEIILNNVPGALALVGETLGKNNISLEGGGVFQYGQYAIAHFLVADPQKAKEFLHSENEEKPEVTGDPSETAEDHDLNPETKNVGEADVDGLLKDMDNPDPDDDDDFDLDDDDDLPIEPDGDDLDDEDLDHDDEEDTYLK